MPVIATKKRSHNERSIEEKLAMLEEFRTSGLTQRNFCNKYGIAPQTFGGWKVLESRWVLDKQQGKVGNKFRPKKVQYPDVELALFKWFCDMRRQNAPLSQEILITKATL